MAFGSNPTTTTQTTLANNQFPLSTVAVPNHAGGNLTALRGANASTDSNGNETADASMAIPDGNNVAQGTTTDAAVTNPALSATEIALIKGLLTRLNTLVTNSPALGQAAMTASAPVVIANNQSAVPVSGTVGVNNFPATQTVSGTVTANVGTTNGLALDTSVNGVIVAQGSTTSGEKGALVQGAVTTTPPAYTSGQTSPISLTQVGAVRTDASATTQPISGTVTANAGSGNFTVAQATPANLNAQVVGLVASAGSNAGNPIKTGGAFNTTQPTVTTGQIVDAQMTARGAQIVATGADTFNATINAALPTGANVIGSTTIQATSGTALVADQTNSELRVSTYGKNVAAGDTALSVTAGGALHVNVDNTNTNGQTTMANSAPVAIASDQSAVRTRGDFVEQLSLTAGSLNADLVPSTDVSAYRSAALQITGVFVGTLTFQCSNDNVNFVSQEGFSSATLSNIVTITTGVGVFFIPLNARYLRVRMTSYVSGTANATLELYTSSFSTLIVSALSTQNGTWTVQPGNTPNTTPWLTTQANNNASVPTGAANTVVKAAAGSLATLVVTTAGTGAGNVQIFDNASTNSGTVLFAFPATVSVAQAYQIYGWAKVGMTAQNVLNGPVFTVYYS